MSDGYAIPKYLDGIGAVGLVNYIMTLSPHTIGKMHDAKIRAYMKFACPEHYKPKGVFCAVANDIYNYVRKDDINSLLRLIALDESSVRVDYDRKYNDDDDNEDSFERMPMPAQPSFPLVASVRLRLHQGFSVSTHSWAFPVD